MARPARIKSETGIYHIMLRGIDRRQLFFDDEDYKYFLSLLQRYKTMCGCELYAYCLMGNHIHLLLKEGMERTEMIFRRLGSAFAYWYNTKYERTGHVFQDRYKSEPVNNEQYLLTTFRYILRNPVAAGICRSPEEYLFSSAGEYICGKKGFTDTEEIFRLFNGCSLKDFIMKDNEDSCLEINMTVHKRLSDAAAREVIRKEFGTLTPEVGTKENRASFLAAVRNCYQVGVSIRQMNRLTGISRGILQRYR